MSESDGTWVEIEKKYFVHEESKADFLWHVKKGNKFTFQQSLDSFRDQVARHDNSTEEEQRELTGFKGTIEYITIPADHLAEGIPTTIYKPEVVPDNPVIIVYFRGGGLVVGLLKICMPMLMSIVHYTGAILVAPEYRNLPCPEDRFAPFTDCEAAARWVLDNKPAVGGVVDSPVGLSGDSAGGQLCCSVNYSIPNQFAFQVLYYPVTNLEREGYESFEELWSVPAFCGRDMAQLLEWCQLLEEPSQIDNPRVNPSAPRHDPPLSASPPTLLIIAELDPLRDWGTEYAAKLRDAGVHTEEHVVEGVTHGFTFSVSNFKTCSARAFQTTADFVQQFKPQQQKL